jgi:penicillin-binding protein 1C
MKVSSKWRRRAAAMLQLGLAGLMAGWLALKLVPIPAALQKPPPGVIDLTDRNGATLRETRTGSAFSRPVRLAEVPPHVVKAFLAAEDKRFYDHGGIDWLAIARAARDGIRHRRVVSGASTITEQLIKVAEHRPRTFRTKLIEAATAIRLEQLWSKDRILEEYLNRVDFGNLNVGVACAADYYFGKPLIELSDAEAAFLAGLPKNPTRLNPHRALTASRRRQGVVLRRMCDNGWIGPSDYERALAEPPHLAPPQRQFRAPHFVDLVLRQVEGGGQFRTTLDLDLNQYVERQLHEQLSSIRALNATNGAAVVIDNATGGVLALVGSENYFAPGTGQFNGATARRSPGSTMKPFTYLFALEQGANAATIYPDVPTEFSTPTGNYRVENYQRRCSGPVSLRSALACSLNIPAVHALNSVGGPVALFRRLKEFGFSTLDRSPAEYGLGLTLGNAEARLLDLANAYSALARLGEYRPWMVFADEAPAGTHQVAPSRECWLIADILSDNNARLPSFGLESPLRFDFPVACKTGTSTDYRDNWAMAYTPEFTVGVWVGNFDGSPMHGVSGVTGAAPLMHAIMEHLHARFGTSWFAPPPNVVSCAVHSLTGKRLCAPRPDARMEKFLAEQLPPMESPGDYDEGGMVKLPSVYSEWLASPESTLTQRASSTFGTLQITAPKPGTTFVIDPDLPASHRARLTAIGGSEVRWSSDSLTCNGSEVDLAEGEHKLVATDTATGARSETWIRVKAL